MSKLSNERSIDPGYRLIDFGGGRKLESFGGRVLDRPCPAAEAESRRRPDRWNDAQAVFCGERRQWDHRKPWTGSETVQFDGFRMPISPTPFGHIGVFPEQADNWRWLMQTAPDSKSGACGLNLFAYSGGGSVAMAATGMKVAHVDAARQNVATARSAAQLNGLGEHPIRYLVDDAAKFVAREVRRGNRYHTIMMDPPTYGHSPSGKAWRLDRDLWPLIDDCLSILTPQRFRLLITGHAPQVGSSDVVDYLASRIPQRMRMHTSLFDSIIDSGRMTLSDSSNRALDAGFFVRCTFNSPDA